MFARLDLFDWYPLVSQNLPADVAVPAEGAFDAYAIQQKWQERWAEADPFRAGGADDTRPRKYVLGMFRTRPGDLHMGHAESYAYVDVVAPLLAAPRLQRPQPDGWDSFGLPAENAAIQRGADPREWTYANIEQHKKSFREYGSSYDWSRILHTSDPEYYRWNQWLFQRLYERGLAYRKDSPVNWCPNDQTVLANEQVVDGHCERCGAEVVKKKLTQWYFKITDYADRLLDDLNQLEGFWPSRSSGCSATGSAARSERTSSSRSRGAQTGSPSSRPAPTPCTARRSSSSPRTAISLPSWSRPLMPTCGRASRPTSSRSASRPRSSGRAPTDPRPACSSAATRSIRSTASGCRCGPRTTCSPITATAPSWPCLRTTSATSTSPVRSICLCGSSSTPPHRSPVPFRSSNWTSTVCRSIRARTRHPSADLDPARTGIALSGDGRMINSGSLNGLSKRNAIARITEELAAAGAGRAAKSYSLRDWLISRQRFWGTPIPMIHTADGRIVPVPEDQLPLTLPAVEGLDLTPKGTSPLGAATEWMSTVDPETGEPALRDADTMDTFVDSSWYFLRFLAPNDHTQAFPRREADRWAPVDSYIGGVEHAILHLLYARFITKVLFDMGLRGFHRAVLEPHQPGHGALGRLEDVQEQGKSGRVRREHDAPWRRRRARRDRLRWTGRRRHQLGGRLDHRRAEVPRAGLARRERCLESP